MLMLGCKGLRIDHLWLETFFEGGSFLFSSFPLPFFMSLMDMPRGHISVPPYIDVNTASYFVGRGT